MDTWQRDLLTELLATYGPCGQEDAVRDVCRRELSALVDELRVDPAGNLVGLVRGAAEGAPAVRVTAHMDELSMIVKRVEPNGDLHVQQLGTMNPGNFGLGPVAVLGDVEEVTAVLTLGSEHTTVETQQVWQTQPQGGDRALDWQHVRVFTGRTPEQLATAGVHVGTRVCVHRSRRALLEVGDLLGCYFLDDRLALVAVISAARALREQGGPPAGDVHLVLTTEEEVGGVGASWAARTLPGDVVLALDVVPAEPEYGTALTCGPVVAYADTAALYDKRLADSLVALGQEISLSPSRAVLGAYESDASNAKAQGQTARAALIGPPVLSTHGFEVVHSGAVDALGRLLTEFLRRPLPA